MRAARDKAETRCKDLEKELNKAKAEKADMDMLKTTNKQLKEDDEKKIKENEKLQEELKLMAADLEKSKKKACCTIF